jgi:ribosomal protein S12 methylthiotransferase accessory factor
MIPEAPMLHPRCHVIRDSPGVVVRRGRVSLRVSDAPRAERLISLVERLDGRSSEAVVGALGSRHWRESIQILEELNGAGMLMNGHSLTEPEALPSAAVDAPRGTRLAVIGEGALANRLETELRRAGSLAAGLPPLLRIVCPSGPNLVVLEGMNREARRHGWPWVPVFKLGSDLIAGPIIEPQRQGCFRCFELRWLGLAPAIRSEMAYFRWLREGGWEREPVMAHEVATLVSMTLTLVAGWLTGKDDCGRLLFLDVDSGGVTDSRLSPHPDCDVCGRVPEIRDASTVWAHWESASAGPSIEHCADRLLRLTDDRIGLVGRFKDIGCPLDGESGIVLIAKTAQFALPRVDRLQHERSNLCGGLQPTERLATLVSIAEGLERYCGVFPFERDVRASYDDVSAHAVSPAALPLFSEAQYAQHGFPFRRFDSGEPLSWMWGYSLTRDVPRLILRSAVTYGPTDDALVAECSSGVAAATSRVEAAFCGLLEMIERDAFMIVWLNRLSPPLADLDTLPAGFASSAVARIRANGYQPFVANLTTEFGVPVILAMAVRRDGGSHALVVGAGCAFDPAVALEKALREVLGTMYGQIADPDWRLASPMQPEDVKTIDDHHGAYSHPSWLPRAEFLWSSAQRQQFEELTPVLPPDRPAGERLATAVEALGRHGFEVIAVDLTTPDVATSGLHVVRAVVPGLQPIGFGPHAARLGGRRVFEAPCHMGCRATPLREHELNTDPHCFP